jgi:hypothetical protein
MQKILYILSIILLPFLVPAQTKAKDSCFLNTSIKAFIAEAPDTVISKQTLAKGFQLRLSDSSFKVTSFYISFYASGDFNNYVFYQFRVDGSELIRTNTDTSLSYVKKLDEVKGDLFIDNIKIVKGKHCLSVGGIFYFINKKPERKKSVEKFNRFPVVH